MTSGSNHCISFLKWALPKLDMRWEGYKKVRGQVCKRITKRLRELRLEDYAGYKAFLEKHPDEWKTLDAMTHITISRFFRDKKQWDVLEQELLPGLVKNPGNASLRVWCAGCAGGEEPYSFAILWKQFANPDDKLELIATDVDERMLKRAEKAVFTEGSLKGMPVEWRKKAFMQEPDSFELKKEYRKMVHFKKQDIRTEMPEGPFDIIFCKNLVAMYFEEQLAVNLFDKIASRMESGGFLFLGNHEEILGINGIKVFDKGINLYKKELEIR